MSKIERSNSAGRFTSADLAAKVRESRTYWSSPAGVARRAELDRESRSRKTVPTRFPSAAGTLKPRISGADEALIARFI